ncbi:D-alanyl-D-alanine carboxypeptidase family protein [Microbacterium indicum]|uniref:D-alanyl-D-alanine carboxypeptidase family protein n=1 Tax=Microbacterium indicum TaxID=358100 RepID=UPI000688B5B2|nr:D-alanyl-D-alanine carboxypeptidase [Microbacterium indicum]
MSTDEGTEVPAGEEREPEKPVPTEPVPTITGIFASIPDDEDPAPAAEPFVDGPQPQTDSVRLFAEMFAGFRRRTSTSHEELQQKLGAATAGDAEAAAPDAPPAAPTPVAEAGAEAETAPDPEADPSPEPADPEPAPAADPAPTPPADAAPDDAEDPTPVSDPNHPTVRTHYVPKDGANETERALAWLTAENVGTGQTPIVGYAQDLVPRRRRRWVGAVFAPIITAIVLAVAYVVTFAVFPLDNVQATVTAAQLDAPAGAALDLPWPQDGEAAVAVEGIDGTLTSSDDQTPLPMASLTKLITVQVFLERQPLAVGEDGPSYDFGYLDQNEADALRWAGETYLDVPVGGQLTYREMLDGILLASAGNYINKLIDELWDDDRDAYVTSALTWISAHGLTDTVVVDGTGISASNQSTPSDMIEVAKLAMADPVLAEIVGTQEVEIPGNDEPIENSNPLLGEDGIVGLKTGTLDTYWNVDYNLSVARDVDTGTGEPTRVYAVVMGQPDAESRETVSRDLLDSLTEALQPVEALADGTVVATATTEWGGSASVVNDGSVSLPLWDGEQATIDPDYDVEVGDGDGFSVGTATVSSSEGEESVDLKLDGDLPRPTLEWRLTHPLELLGVGGSSGS